MNRHQRRQAARDARRRPDRNAARAVPAVFVEPVLYSRVYTEEQAAEICNAARMAWWRIAHGDGSRDDFDMLADVCNVLLVRAERIDNGAPMVTAVLGAQAALIDLQAAIRRTGRVAASAATLRTVPELLDLYMEVLRHSTAHQMVQASQEARRRTYQQINQRQKAQKEKQA